MTEYTIDKVLSVLSSFIKDSDTDHYLKEKLLIRLTNIVANNIMEQEEKNKLGGKCIICFKEKSEYVFIPCGHFCYCECCVDILKSLQNIKCPICRKTGDYYKVFPACKEN